MHGQHQDIAPLCALSEAEGARALERYGVLQPCVEHGVPLAHDGSKAYRTTFDLLYRCEADTSNDIWQADHTLLALWVRQDSGPRAIKKRHRALGLRLDHP